MALPETNNTIRLKNLLTAYGVYLFLFVGTGFLSGSIVHYPLNPGRFLVIGIVGALIFTTASTVNEVYFNKKNFKDKGLAALIFYSIVLSIGIGMVSGGVQHFDEFPVYASYLLPLGILLSVAAYTLKSSVNLTSAQKGKLAAGVLALILPLGLVLNLYAQAIRPAGHHGPSEMGHMMTPELHRKSINSEEMFVAHMIAHHAEAVTASEQIAARTQNKKLFTLATAIAEKQKAEIEQLQDWQLEWYKGERIEIEYRPIMHDLSGIDLHLAEELYINGMIAHHTEAILMAKELLASENQLVDDHGRSLQETTPVRQELRNFAQSVIDTQEKEIRELERLQELLINSTGDH